MPVHRVPGGWQWGNSGKVYPKKADALDQQSAAIANGFHENKKKQHAAKTAAIQNLMKKHASSANEEAGEPKLSPRAEAREEAAEPNDHTKQNQSHGKSGSQPPWLAAANSSRSTKR